MTVGLPIGPSYITGRKYNNPTIQSIMNKIDPIAEAVDLSDHIDWRDPLGWSTLGQRWGDKTIGKKWREGQMQDVWDAVPEEWRPKIAESAMSAAEGIGNYWEGARTVDNWFNPLELAEAGTVRTLEGLALPFEGLAQLTSAGTGLDIELSRIVADFIPIGGIAKRGVGLARRGKLMKRLLDKIPAQTVHAMGPSDTYNQFKRALAGKNYREARRLFNELDLYEQRVMAGDQAELLFQLGKKFQDKEFLDALSRNSPNIIQGQKQVDEIRAIMTRMGMTDDVFDFDKFLDPRSGVGPGQKRKLAGLFKLKPEQAISFEQWKRSIDGGAPIMSEFKEFWKPVFERLAKQVGKTTEEIGNFYQWHHIEPLIAGMGLQDGLKYGSPEWVDVWSVLFKNLRGAGDTPENLTALFALSKGMRGMEKTPHNVVHLFLKDVIGDDGSKFFTPAIRSRMKTDHLFRLKQTERYAELIKKSERIVEQALENLRLTNPNFDITDAENLIEQLSKFDRDGYLPTSRRYQVDGMANLVRIIEDQRRLSNIKGISDLTNPAAIKAIMIAARSDEPISAFKALRIQKYGDIKQLDLFLDYVSDTEIRQMKRLLERGDDMRHPPGMFGE